MMNARTRLHAIVALAALLALPLGAEAQARELSRSKVKTVVAVSCEPRTFARDAQILVAGGYRLEKVSPVDQFAWSMHVEVVGVFRK